MNPVRQVSGSVAALDMESVDTDQIIPKQYLKRIERTGFGQFLFDDWMKDPDFPLRRPEFSGAPILVTGANFGCGSSREHAPWALQDYGFDAIVAESFADIFRTNCSKIGLLTVELPRADVRELIEAAPAEVTIDLETERVTLPSGREAAFATDPDVRERLLNGWDDIALTELNLAEIEAYESTRERQGPDTTKLLNNWSGTNYSPDKLGAVSSPFVTVTQLGLRIAWLCGSTAARAIERVPCNTSRYAEIEACRSLSTTPTAVRSSAPSHTPENSRAGAC